MVDASMKTTQRIIEIEGHEFNRSGRLLRPVEAFQSLITDYGERVQQEFTIQSQVV